jgi:hypothetical protein
MVKQGALLEQALLSEPVLATWYVFPAAATSAGVANHTTIDKAIAKK